MSFDLPEIYPARDLPDWWPLRGCKGKPVDLFFPPSDERRHPDYSEALAVCMACDVREECLEYAITHGEDDGMWGGVRALERRRLRRLRGIRYARLVLCPVCGSSFSPKGRQLYCSRPCAAHQQYLNEAKKAVG